MMVTTEQKIQDTSSNIGIIAFVDSKSEGKKRLLVNDPDVLAERLNRLEGVVNSLSSQLQEEKSKRESQEILIRKLTSEHRTSATYVRWGKKSCPGNDTTLYSGYIGGGFYGETGSSAVPVCLPPDPDFTKTAPYSKYVGHVYGTEFETNYFAPNSFDEDVPCSVCELNGGTQTIMIPGKNTCYSGWAIKYKGNLGSGYYAHASASSFICVDESPDFLTSGEKNTDGKLLFEVVSKCGALPCPPYHDGYPLTCVLCSK